MTGSPTEGRSFPVFGAFIIKIARFGNFFQKNCNLFEKMCPYNSRGVQNERKGKDALEDSVIVDLYLQRDETAIEHTAEKYGSRIRSLAYRMLGDIRTAEECENDTYFEAWNSIPPYEPREHFYAFLAGITRHSAVKLLRYGNRAKRSGYLSELNEELGTCLPTPNATEEEADNAALCRAINEFLAGLDKEKRVIFIRHYWYLDTAADIAKRYSISESKVKTTLFRCREQLKKYLEKEGYSI